MEVDPSELQSTQDLLQQMDSITEGGPDITFSEIDNTQQIVNNIDRITATQTTDTCGENTTMSPTCDLVATDKSQGPEHTNSSIPHDTDFLKEQSVDPVNIDSHDINSSFAESCTNVDSAGFTQSTDSPIEKQFVLNETLREKLPLEDSLSKINTSEETHSSNECVEPPVKKSKSDTSENQSLPKPVFQFVPRNVSQLKTSSLLGTCISNKNKQRTDKCSSNTDTENSVSGCKEDNRVMYESKGDNFQHTSRFNDSSSSDSEPEQQSGPIKSYDANVVLPADIVRSWRTSGHIEEGEIIELERGCDDIFTSQPACFGRAVYQSEENYLRGCKWSPDGTCLLTNSNDNRLRTYPITTDETNQGDLICTQTVKESDTVYDFCWYNKMTSSDPETCCFLTTCRDSPIHMWEMSTGKLKCSYRPYNHLDEMTTAHSLAFSLDGTKLYSGFNKMIRVFDVSRPGRVSIQRPTFVKHQGQPGIISCLAASPQGLGIYAAGSFARTIALYHEPDGNMLCMFQGQQGGVTHIGFSPDGTKLYSGGRKDPEILCWDLRKPGQILFVALRMCETNQRIYFDQDRSGRYLFSGCHDGTVCIWDTTRPPVKVLEESDPLLKPVMKFKAHGDCVNGVSINSSRNVLATCSGQRHYPDQGDSDNSDDDSVNNDIIENSVKLWKFSS